MRVRLEQALGNLGLGALDELHAVVVRNGFAGSPEGFCVAVLNDDNHDHAIAASRGGVA